MALDYTQLTGREPPEAQIEALIYHFAWLVDHGREIDLPDLFVEQGTLIVPDIAGDWTGFLPVQGQEALRNRWQGTHQKVTRHVFANVRVALTGDGSASATSLAIGFRLDGAGLGFSEPFLVGDYLDKLVRTPERRWLFTERKVVPAFAGRQWHPSMR